MRGNSHEPRDRIEGVTVPGPGIGWQRTGAHSANGGDVSLRWLDYNDGVEYRDRGRTIVLGAGCGGNEMRDAEGRPRVMLYLGMDPDAAWHTGEVLGEAERQRVLATAREGLEWLGFIVHMNVARPEYGRWFVRSLPWGARVRFVVGRALANIGVGKGGAAMVAAFGVVVLAAAQMWLSAALSQGRLGRAPEWAVFGPALVWLAFDAVALASLVGFVRRRDSFWIVAAIVLVICFVGSYVAWAGARGFLLVV